MMGGGSSINGYVQLTEVLHERWRDIQYDDIPLDVHGGLTYGPDPEGWIGFDTAHHMDYWALDDVAGRVGITDLKALATVHDTMHRATGARRWTFERLRAEVERLADQVAAESLA